MSLYDQETYRGPQAELVVVPLFILMGNVATETGMSRKLYDAAYALYEQQQFAPATTLLWRANRIAPGISAR